MSQDYLDKLIEKDKAGTQIQSIPLHDTELRGITIDDPITVEGNPINFSTKNEQNAIQTVVDLEPIQDLHGYSKPWVGGAGKNLLILNLDHMISSNTGSGSWSNNVFTLNNITFTVLFDNDNNIIGIKVNGTANANTAFSFLKNGVTDYTLYAGKQVVINGGTSAIKFQYWSTSASYVDSGSGASFTFPSTKPNNWNVSLFIASGTAIDNVIMQPMLRLSTVTDSTFEPYENICPILPHEEIKIGGCGKNLFNSKILMNGTQYLLCEEFKVKPGTYNFIFTNNSSNMMAFWARSGYDITDDTTKFVNAGKTVQTTYEVTGEGIIAFGFRHNPIDSTVQITDVKDAMFLVSTETDLTYEPYTLSNSLTLPLPEDVYGGTLNLETGELRVTHNIIDLGTVGFTYYAASSGSPNRFAKSFTTIMKDGCELICEIYESKTRLASTDNYVISSQSGWLTIVNLSYGSDATSLNASLSGYKVVYELLDTLKYTIHLTPSQLKLFKDVNNLNSSDYTTLTVTYHSNSIATLAPATDTTDGLLTAMDKRALDRTEEIVEGNPIAFETESAQVAKSTIIDLEPIQDLHGYSKPWVGGAGKNLYVDSPVFDSTWTNYNYWSKETETYNGHDVYSYTLQWKGLSKSITLPVGTYTFSCMCKSTDATTIGIYFTTGTTTATVSPVEKGFSVTTSWVKYSLTFEVTSAGTIQPRLENSISNGAKIYISEYQLEKASSATSYESYENICPISGRSAIEIKDCGKNLFDPSSVVPGYINGATGEIAGQNATNLEYTTPFIKILGNSVSVGYYGYQDSESMWCCVGFYDVSYNFLSRPRIDIDNKFTVSVPAKAVYCRFSTRTFGHGIEYCYGSFIDERYEPFKNGSDIAISLGTTVYGGQLDVENGVLVVDRGIADLGDFTYTKQNVGSSDAKIFYTNFDVISNIKYYGIDEMPNSICSCFVNDTAIRVSNGALETINQGYTTSHRLRICSLVYASLGETEFKTIVTGQKLVYELATPTTISLTPEQVKLLQGVNTITTNADNITLTYRNGSVATLNDLESLYAKLKAYIDSLHSS